MLAFYHDLYLKVGHQHIWSTSENEVMPILCYSEIRPVPATNKSTEQTEKPSGEMHLLPALLFNGHIMVCKDALPVISLTEHYIPSAFLHFLCIVSLLKRP